MNKAGLTDAASCPEPARLFSAIDTMVNETLRPDSLGGQAKTIFLVVFTRAWRLTEVSPPSETSIFLLRDL